jgi:hypothetical protein
MGTVRKGDRRPAPRGPPQEDVRHEARQNLALRTRLEARVDEIRQALVRLEAAPRGKVTTGVARLLARIDEQEREWHAVAPHLATGRRPTTPESLARHREIQRVVRKLAVLRGKVLRLDRAAHGSG